MVQMFCGQKNFFRKALLIFFVSFFTIDRMFLHHNHKHTVAVSWSFSLFVSTQTRKNDLLYILDLRLFCGTIKFEIN